MHPELECVSHSVFCYVLGRGVWVLQDAFAKQILELQTISRNQLGNMSATLRVGEACGAYSVFWPISEL